MDRRHVVILGAVLLAGCAGPRVSEPDFDGLLWHIGQRFAHKPVMHMAGRYGVPHEQGTIEGYRVYSWHTDREFRRMLPASSTTTGQVQNPAEPWGQPIPFSYTTHSQREASETWRCTLTAWVDAQGNVANAQVRGQWGACEHFYP
jgi:hypothetical protein